MTSQVSKVLLHRFLLEIILLLLLSLRFSNEINLKLKEILYQSTHSINPPIIFGILK